ncbi:ATP synthase mitochondrial F1 complex assembly factor 1 [Babesia ovis]|uniref:ATP synthase mitochondrial F1 complex assembly factor 1 n=1 Tax=Babesia ovis TaxID=5869 RepID=A0A9W5T7F2_BABOV|nr:ATP synthase mitochondrial F1 complex assembly factor 1 [Babesia ovis]
MFGNISRRYMSFMYPVPRKLSEVAKVPLLMQCDSQKISSLWKQQFKDRNDVVTTTIPAGLYEQLSHNVSSSKMFILPIKVNESSSYNMIVQFANPKSALFTSVDSYKALGFDKSPPYFILTFFDELVKQKGIVLVRGDITNPKDVSKPNAERLMNMTIQFYSDINLYRWVDRFNNRSREFQFEDFVASCRHIIYG